MDPSTPKRKPPKSPARKALTSLLSLGRKSPRRHTVADPSENGSAGALRADPFAPVSSTAVLSPPRGRPRRSSAVVPTSTATVVASRAGTIVPSPARPGALQRRAHGQAEVVAAMPYDSAMAAATGAIEPHHHVYKATSVSTPGRGRGEVTAYAAGAAEVVANGTTKTAAALPAPPVAPQAPTGDAARETQALRQQLIHTRQQLGGAQADLDEKERKLSASLLSIKLYWGPELDKERRLRQTAIQRADAAEVLLREQLGKGRGYMERLNTLQDAYEELERSARTKSEIEEQLRSKLERELGIAMQLANSTATGVADPSPLKTQVLRKDAEIAALRLQVHELEEAAEDSATLTAAMVAPPSTQATEGVSQEVAELNGQLTAAQEAIMELEERVRAADAVVADAHAMKERAHGSLRDRDLMQQARDRVTQELATMRAQHSETLELREQEHARILEGMQGELENMRADRDALQARLHEEQSQHSHILTRLDDQEVLRESLAERDEQMMMLQERARQLTAELDAQQAHVRRVDADISTLRASKEQREAEEAELRIAIASLTNDRDAAVAEVVTVKEALEAERSRANHLQNTAVPAAEARVALLEAEAGQLRKAAADAEGKVARANSERDSSLASLQEKVSDLEVGIRARDDKAAQLENEVAALLQSTRDADMAATQLASKDAEVHQLRKQLEESQKAEQSLNAARVDNAALKAQIFELQQARGQTETALQSEVTKLRVDNASAAAQAAELASQLEQLKRADLRAEELAVALAASNASVLSLQQRTDELSAAETEVQTLRVTTAEQGAEIKSLHEHHSKSAEAHERAVAALRAELQKQADTIDAQHTEQLGAVSRWESEAASLRGQMLELEGQLESRQLEFERKEQELLAAVKDSKAELERVEQGMAAVVTSRQQERDASALREEDHALRVNSLLEDVEAKDALVESLHGEVRKLSERIKAARKQQKQDQEARAQLERSTAAKTQTLEEQLSNQKKQLETSRANCSHVKRTLDQVKADRISMQVATDKAEEALRASVETIKGLGMKLADSNQMIGQLKASCAKKEQEAQDRATTVAELTEALVFEKTSLLLMKVEDKDSKIADLERQGAQKHADRIAKLQAAREEDVKALKEQFDKRAALAASPDNSLVDKSTEEAHDWAGELEDKEAEAARLRGYVDQLLGEVLKQNPDTASAIMTGMILFHRFRYLPHDRI